MRCPTFWLDNPRVLIAEAGEFFPFTENDRRCTAAALNSFTRFGIYLGVILAAVKMTPAWLILGLVFAVFAAGAWKYMEGHGSIREGFQGDYEEPAAGTARYVTTGPNIVGTSQIDTAYVPDIIGDAGRTDPTAANPFMNVLMTEFTDNPDRAPASNVEAAQVRSELDSYFETMFVSDPGDTFQRTQSQRQWVTMPSTTIPNDRDSYQNWLYRTAGRTCKEGDLSQCNFVTDARIPWREIRPAN
jgi:hypothetical protein